MSRTIRASNFVMRFTPLVNGGFEQSAHKCPTQCAVGMVNALVLLITATPYLPPLYLFYCLLQSNIVMHCPSHRRGGLGALVD